MFQRAGLGPRRILKNYGLLLIVAIAAIGAAILGASPWKYAWTAPFVLLVALGIALVVTWRRLRKLERAEFIRTYKLPHGLLDHLARRRPGLTRKQCALVSRGLRQFFLAYLMSGRRFVSMPSQVADDLWHEFILYTRDYRQFCAGAFGGFMHHAPAVALGEFKRGNEGLRRVWWYACRYENIDPRNPTRLPLLFALDAKLNIKDGFHYHPRSEGLREKREGEAEVIFHDAGEFSSTSYDGSVSGFGDSDHFWSGSGSDVGGMGAGDGGGGCGGS